MTDIKNHMREIWSMKLVLLLLCWLMNKIWWRMPNRNSSSRISWRMSLWIHPLSKTSHLLLNHTTILPWILKNKLLSRMNYPYLTTITKKLNSLVPTLNSLLFSPRIHIQKPKKPFKSSEKVHNCVILHSTSKSQTISVKQLTVQRIFTHNSKMQWMRAKYAKPMSRIREESR